MSNNDFQDRLGRIGARQTAPEERPVAAKTGGTGHIVFGFVWGLVLAFSVIYLNQNYEALFRSEDVPHPAALAGIAFFLISLVVLALMLFSGLLYALFGKIGGRRWRVLLGVLIGFALGGVASSMLPMTGRS